MTLIDKAEALLPCPFCGGEAEWKSGGPGCAWISCKSCPAETSDGSIPRIMEAWNRRAALPARWVGVKPLVWDAPIRYAAKREHMSTCRTYKVVEWLDDSGHVLWFGQAGEPIRIDAPDAAVGANALKAAAQADYEARILSAFAPVPADESALAVLAGLSSYLGTGLGDDDTTAEQFDKRIRWAIDDLTARTRQAALREAAAEVQRWFHDGRDNRDPAALILALIGEPRT